MEPNTQTPKSHFSLYARLRYRLDNTFSKGPVGLIAWLAAVALSIIVIIAFVVTLFGVRDNGGHQFTFLEAIWQNMLRALDSGTMGGDNPWPLRAVSLITTIMGLFIVAALIGLLTTAIDRRIRELARGKAKIAVSGHTLILGWSLKVPTIINELKVANENQRHSHVVILAPQDKHDVEELVRTHVKDTGSTRLVVRSGRPSERADLAIVNPCLAKSIIVLNTESTGGDAGVIKTVLALLKEDLTDATAIVAEIVDADNADALRRATEGRVVVVESASIISRATAQAVRQPGLNLAYQELLDFDGSEIYFGDVPQLTGKPFHESLNAFEDSAVLGVLTTAGGCLLNPPMDRLYETGDKVIAVSQDDDTIVYVTPDQFTPVPTPATQLPPVSPERFIVFGWNDLGTLILKELDEYVTAGSSVTVVVDLELAGSPTIELPLKNLSLEIVDTTGGSFAASVDNMALTEYDHVLILCYRFGLTVDEADARALLVLLQVSQALSEAGSSANVITEILDERDVELSPRSSPDEFIVSERLTSLTIAQLSENPKLEAVFSGLFTPLGSELYCKPVERYTVPGTYQFGALVDAARLRGEVAVGYRNFTQSTPPSGGVVINPAKHDMVELTAGDQLIVLAEEDG